MEERKSMPTVTCVLSNGRLVRLPFEGWKERLDELEREIEEEKKKQSGE